MLPKAYDVIHSNGDISIHVPQNFMTDGMFSLLYVIAFFLSPVFLSFCLEFNTWWRKYDMLHVRQGVYSFVRSFPLFMLEIDKYKLKSTKMR